MSTFNSHIVSTGLSSADKADTSRSSAITLSSIFWTVWMTMRAMRSFFCSLFSRGNNRDISFAATDIFSVCYWFKMKGVNTTSDRFWFADMIKFKTFRDWADKKLIGKFISTYFFSSSIGSAAYSELPVSITVFSSGPNPALIIGYPSNKTPKTYFWRFHETNISSAFEGVNNG